MYVKGRGCCSVCGEHGHNKRFHLRHPTNGTKVCSKCLEEKPNTLEFFPSNKSRKDGVSAYCTKCVHKYNKQFYTNNIVRERRRSIESRQRARMQVLSHYSNGLLKCSCANCVETIVEFLTLDHIEGGGAKHKKSIGGSAAIWGWLIRNGYPEGFRVLCMNCNFSLGRVGYCPHDRGEDRLYAPFE